MGSAPTWLRQVSPLLHETTLTTAGNKDNGGAGGNWTYKMRKASVKLQPASYTGQMPFLLPDQECQTTEGKKVSHSADFSPRVHLGILHPSSTKACLPCREGCRASFQSSRCQHPR